MPRKKGRPRFDVGDPVRVKGGVADPDYPDIPIGGWAGTVKTVDEDDPIGYLIHWNQRTLDNLHPVFKNRCERDGLDYEEMWLDEECVEADTGEVTEIELPTAIQTAPLDLRDQDDRIRAIFGLTHDDLLPERTLDSLRTYHEHLSKQLSLPFEATWETDFGTFSSRSQKVTVLGLGDPEKEGRIDDSDGLICEIRIGREPGDVPLSELEIKKRGPNKQLVADYCYWFWNWA